ncbi:S-layer homology domain-containing protein [Herbivorax sp. ANBcel31]|uniref:S-layer homology domain-containing protein n=1 Tax=Herbivorax sp. ANBcel31 TaxID=3069754 RepID=UPI0027B2DD5D|nr:S-layer homology domain-containing protein [Herbivorax sp. ANBcel31]MDQ2086343.1 S-layer homology domain-containing protein [Herbivorax sp. ANBcel31]
MHRKMRKTLAIFTCAAMIFMMCGINVAGLSAQNPGDIVGHWAESEIQNWIERGFITGYDDDTFRPDSNITRAEFVTIANSLFGYKDVGITSFNDVNSEDWFYEEIAKASEIGYISGYEDGTMRPNNPITREEAMAIVCNILRREQSNSTVSLAGFADSEDIADWSRGFVATAVEEGYISGYEDDTIRSGNPIRRAETVAMFNNVATEVVNVAGNSGPQTGTGTIEGNLIVSTSNVNLSNTIVEGILYLTEGIGEGDVNLDNVTVKGDTLIAGGGQDSIVIKDSNLSNTVVQKKNGQIRVEAQGSTDVENLTLKSGARVETKELTGQGFKKIDIAEEASKAAIGLKGNFNEVNVNSDSEVSFEEGTVETLDIRAAAEVNIAENVVVNNLKANAIVAIRGEGTIKNAEVNVSGVSFETQPEELVLKDGVTLADASDDEEETTTTSPSGSRTASETSPTPTPTIDDIIIETEPENVDGVYYEDDVLVMMESATDDVSIYYTVDGSEPSADDTRYEGVFEVSNPEGSGGGSITIKAVAIKDGMDDSDIAELEIVWNPNSEAEPSDSAGLSEALEDDSISLITLDGSNYDGNFTASVAWQTIIGNDATIDGDLTIEADGIALYDVTIDGDLNVEGDSVIVENVDVNDEVTLAEGIDNFTAADTNFDGLTIDGGGSESIRIRDSNLGSMNVNTPGVRTSMRRTTVTTVEVSETAEGSRIEALGNSNITTFNVNANIQRATSSEATVSETTKATGVEIDEIDIREVEFTVMDDEDDPIEGATVNIDGELATTDSDGKADIELTDGTYDYDVYKSGYESTTGTITEGASEETVTMSPRSYTVRFSSNGGNMISEEQRRVTVVHGKTVQSLPDTPTRLGYTFEGWNTDSDGEGTEFTDSTEVDSNMILFAQWEEVVLSVADLSQNYYEAGDTISFTISGFPVNTDVVICMPIFVGESGGEDGPWASDLKILDTMTEEDDFLAYTGTTNESGEIVVEGTVQEGLPYGALHITAQGYGYNIDNTIELQKDGQPVFVGTVPDEAVISHTPQAQGALPTSVVTVELGGDTISDFTLKFDGSELASTTDGEIVVATAVLSDAERLTVEIGDTDYEVVIGQ